MSERVTLTRRTFLAALAESLVFACGGKKMEKVDLVSGAIAREPSQVPKQAYRILETEVDPWQLNPYEGSVYSAIRSRPEELLPIWEPQDIPTYLNIFAIGFSMPIQPVTETGFKRTPDEGIATDVLGHYPSVYVYGHTSLQGVQREFGNIVYLNRGNLIMVNNDRDVPHLFAVLDFTIDDVNQDIDPSEDLTLILQGTLKEYGKYKIDRKVAESKASKVVGGANLNFYVWAKPVRARVPNT